MKYSPPWNEKVSGEWEVARDPDTGAVEPFWVQLACTECGDKSRAECSTGAPHPHVQNYARAHFHGDPLKTSR